MGHDKHIKYGGVRFTNNAKPEEINKFVRQLPADKKDSLFEVIGELEKEGLISVENGHVSTIDDELIEFLDS
jgi:hypothetical protein